MRAPPLVRLASSDEVSSTGPWESCSGSPLQGSGFAYHAWEGAMNLSRSIRSHRCHDPRQRVTHYRAAPATIQQHD
jgi:hypothetical protein